MPFVVHNLYLYPALWSYTSRRLALFIVRTIWNKVYYILFYSIVSMIYDESHDSLDRVTAIK